MPNRRASGRPQDGLAIWLGRAILPALSIMVCLAFLAAITVLAFGLLVADYVLVGFIVWILPRLGLIALGVLLVRFVTATDAQPHHRGWNQRHD